MSATSYSENALTSRDLESWFMNDEGPRLGGVLNETTDRIDIDERSTLKSHDHRH
jgi:hypothetical protein